MVCATAAHRITLRDRIAALRTCSVRSAISIVLFNKREQSHMWPVAEQCLRLPRGRCHRRRSLVLGPHASGDNVLPALPQRRCIWNVMLLSGDWELGEREREGEEEVAR